MQLAVGIRSMPAQVWPHPERSWSVLQKFLQKVLIAEDAGAELRELMQAVQVCFGWLQHEGSGLWLVLSSMEAAMS